MGKYIELVARDGHLFRAFVEEPARPAHAAVVLLQEMDQRTPGLARTANPETALLPGVNRHIRATARWLADQGYLVVCPSTFSRGQSGRDYGYRFEPKGAWGLRIVKPLQPLPSEPVMLDIRASVDHARRCVSGARVGLLGYCWGGLLAWRAAAQWTDLQAAVCLYAGGIESVPEMQRQPRVPVQVHLPGGDAWMTADGIQAFVQTQTVQAQDSGRANVELHVYTAPYGFAQPGRASHRPQIQAQAHQRCLAFLRQHLGLDLG